MRGPFALGVAADPFWNGKKVLPRFSDKTAEEIAAGGYKELQRPPVPPGYTGTYPFIVKVNTSGEFVVYADGTAQYMDYKTGEISDPIRIKPGF